MWRIPDMVVLVVVLSLVCVVSVGAQTRHDHLTTTCNAAISTSVGGRLEASTELTYQNDMNCVFKVTAPENKLLLIKFNWFDIEQKIGGACVDYLNIYDGNDVTAVTLNSEPLCGEQKTLGNMTSSGRYVTFQFVTDANAVWRGFDLMYTVYSNAPCSAADFACSNSLCMDSTLKCDGFDHCGDGSDEATSLCTVETAASTSGLSMGAYIGIGAAGLFVLIVVLIIIYKVVDYYRWQKFLKENDLHTNPWDEEEEYQYPVTKHYHSGKGAPWSASTPDIAQEVTAEETRPVTSSIEDQDGGGVAGLGEETKLQPERTKSLMLREDEGMAKPYTSEA